MSAATARSPSDPLDGQCMLTAVVMAVVDGSPEHRLSTAVQDDIPSTTHNLTMLIAAAHQTACAASLRTCGSSAIERESVAAVLTAAYGHGAERLAELSYAMITTGTGRIWLPAAHARRHQHRGR